MAALGVAGLPVLVIDHPLGGEGPEGVDRRIGQTVEQLAGLLGSHSETDQRPRGAELGAKPHPLGESRLTVPEERVYAEFVAREWCDGLPIVAPTPERVAAMLAGARADGDLSLGLMPPLWRECTLEKLAVNAVMAGAESELLSHHRRGRPGHAGARLQPLRRPGDDASGGAARHRQRPVCAGHRTACGCRPVRPRLSRQRHDRPRHAPRRS